MLKRFNSVLHKRPSLISYRGPLKHPRRQATSNSVRPFLSADQRTAPATSTSKEREDREERLAWLRKDLHVVLVNPVIPQNTGSIARTCAATSVGLHLVGPMGFKIDDKKLKRAGLDYWEYVAVRQYESWQDFHEFFDSLEAPKRLIGFSKFAKTHYAAKGQYMPGDWLLFGSETSGLPEEIHDLLPVSQMVKIPMRQTHVRSLNLAVSAGIGIFEALRQLDGAELGEDSQ